MREDEVAKLNKEMIERDIATIRVSRQQMAEGKVQDVETAFAQIRAELIKMRLERKREND